MTKKKNAEQVQQMRVQLDGSIVAETSELIASEADEERRKEELEEVSQEVIKLMGKDADKSCWIELFTIIHKVEEDQLYLPEYKSLNAWMSAIAERGGFEKRELWRRKRAGEAYKEYERQKEIQGKRVRELEQLAGTRGLTPRNLETITKIAGGNPKVKEKLIDRLVAGKVTGAELNKQWKAAKEAGAKVRKTRHDDPEMEDKELEKELEEELNEAMKDMSDEDREKAEAIKETPEERRQKIVTAGRIVAAIQAANDGEWLPDKSKDTNRPWSLKKYRVYTETAVYMGTTEKPIHMDAVVAETMGCVNLTDMMLHVIEIKISENDLKRDHKMQEYARCADYMWLAVPEELKTEAEKYIDESQGKNNIWGLMLLHEEEEGDHLIIARTPKRIDMIGGPLRGKLFESLAAKYL